METLTTISVWLGVLDTEEKAAGLRAYCAWKKSNHRPDLVDIVRKPASLPVLQVVPTRDFPPD